ncbi:phage portal protein [Coprococcus sp. AF27-8]|nr:phage portal protein [Coprococcus sp. AF27-8]
MLTEAEIKRFIDNDSSSEKKKFAEVGQRYYEANHDILKSRLFYYNADGNLVEDTTRSNIKISHPFFTELSDQLSAYMLSFKENPIRAKEAVEGLQDYLDEYFDDDFYTEISELITGAYNKGFEYIYAYKNAEGRLAFQCADSLGVIEVRAKDTDDECEYFIYWYIDRIDKGKKEIRRIQVWSNQETWYYVQLGNGRVKIDDSVPINPRPHVVFTEKKKNVKKGYSFGFIPFWRLDNNKKQISGLKPIKALIDDYDLMECGISNNLADFDTPLHVVTGFQGDNLDELQTNLKTKKILGVDEGGGVEVKTVDIPYQARKAKADEDEKNIYRFGMGFNSSQVGDGNITNVVIRSRYALLDLKANKLERRLKKLLKQLVKVVLDEINKMNKTDYKVSDVYFDFVREITTNESENYSNEKTKAETQQVQINTILNVAAVLDDETIVKAICEVLDIDYEEIKDKLPSPDDGMTQAEVALSAVVPEEGTEQGGE